jgi:hypothetical protein
MRMFCSSFDEALAHTGPAAIFLPDPDGLWRVAPNWSRDAWNRNPGEHKHGLTYILARDLDSGFVQLVLCTSPTLIDAHPRLQIRVFPTEAAARAAREAIGRPPVAPEAW